MGTKPLLRKIARIQRDDKIGLARLGAGTERLVIRIWRNITACDVRNLFRLLADQVDGCTDVMRTDTAARKNLSVFFYDRFVDEPEEGIVFDPVP